MASLIQPDAAVDPILVESADLPPGTVVGRFTIEDRLGSGGMGVVYRAYDVLLDRQVAIKLMHPRRRHRADTADRAQQRLVTEAQAMAKLAHPCVVGVLDVGTYRGEVFVAMELVRGTTLTTWLTAQPRSWREIVEVFRQAATGLHAAHTAGLVHRDFKPDNVLVDHEGRVRVTDFGLAVSNDQSTPSSSSPGTVSGLTLPSGTPAYMAPEQFRAEPTTAYTDQFAFCVALHEALFGTRPFVGRTTSSIAYNVLMNNRVSVPRRPGIPVSIVRAINKGLAIEPSRRHGSMAVLIAVLAPRRRRAGPIAGGAVLAGLAAVVGALGARTATDPRTCDGREAMAAQWNTIAQAEIAAAFRATGVPFADKNFQRLRAVVERQVLRWEAAFDKVCAAAPSAEPDPLALARRCLDTRVDEVTNMVAALRMADAAAVARAPSAVVHLMPPEPCLVGQDSLARATTRLPELRDQAHDLYQRIATARIQRELGDPRKALAMLGPIIDDARKFDVASITSQALVELGHAQLDLGDLKAAEATLFDAIEHGSSAYADLTVAQAHQLLVHTTHQMGRLDDAWRYSELALAAVARAGGEPQPRATIHFARAVIARDQHAVDRAMAELDAASAEMAKLGPDIDREIPLSIGIVRAQILYEAGRYQEAERALITLLRDLEIVVGRDHPHTLAARELYASLLARTARYQEAIAAYRQVVAQREHMSGAQASSLASPLSNLAMALLDVEHNEEALSLLVRTRELERQSGAEGAGLFISHLQIATALYELGRYEEALEAISLARSVAEQPVEHGIALSVMGSVEHARGRQNHGRRLLGQGLALMRDGLGDDHPSLANAQTELARAHLQRGSTRKALPLLVRARALQKMAGLEDLSVAETEFLLARALPASQRGEACAYARAAHDRYLAVSQFPAGKHAAAVAQWSARKRCPTR